MNLEAFPKQVLVPGPATLARAGDKFDLRIELQPFTLDDEMVETAFCLDGVRLPPNPQTWRRRTFTLARNPEAGHVDGSIYPRHAHNPADVSRISFGEFTGDSIDAEIVLPIDFEFEGTGFANTDVTFQLPLRLQVT